MAREAKHNDLETAVRVITSFPEGPPQCIADRIRLIGMYYTKVHGIGNEMIPVEDLRYTEQHDRAKDISLRLYKHAKKLVEKASREQEEQEYYLFSEVPTEEKVKGIVKQSSRGRPKAQQWELDGEVSPNLRSKRFRYVASKEVADCCVWERNHFNSTFLPLAPFDQQFYKPLKLN